MFFMPMSQSSQPRVEIVELFFLMISDARYISLFQAEHRILILTAVNLLDFIYTTRSLLNKVSSRQVLLLESRIDAS